MRSIKPLLAIIILTGPFSILRSQEIVDTNMAITGQVKSVSIRLNLSDSGLADDVIALKQDSGRNYLDIILRERPNISFLMPVEDVVNFPGFDDLKGRDQILGGLLLMRVLQERLVGKSVVLSYDRPSNIETGMIFIKRIELKDYKADLTCKYNGLLIFTNTSLTDIFLDTVYGIKNNIKNEKISAGKSFISINEPARLPLNMTIIWHEDGGQTFKSFFDFSRIKIPGGIGTLLFSYSSEDSWVSEVAGIRIGTKNEPIDLSSAARENLTSPVTTPPWKKLRKNDYGLALGGISGSVFNKYLKTGLGYGGSLECTFGSKGIFGFYFAAYDGNLKSVSGLNPATAIHWLKIDMFGKSYLSHSNNPFKPYVLYGASLPMIRTTGYDMDFEGVGLFLGPGIDIWIGRFFSIFAEGRYGYNFIFENSTGEMYGNEDIGWVYKQYYGFDGGLKLVIPLRNKIPAK